QYLQVQRLYGLLNNHRNAKNKIGRPVRTPTTNVVIVCCSNHGPSHIESSVAPIIQRTAYPPKHAIKRFWKDFISLVLASSTFFSSSIILIIYSSKLNC